MTLGTLVAFHSKTRLNRLALFDLHDHEPSVPILSREEVKIEGNLPGMYFPPNVSK